MSKFADAVHNAENEDKNRAAAAAAQAAADAQAAKDKELKDAQNKAMSSGPELMYNPLNPDGTLKNEYKLGSADSYLAALRQQEQLNAVNARDTAAQTAQTGIAQSKENLAMRGGIGANNSALLEAQGMKMGLQNQQSASNQSAQNMANIGVQGAGAQLGIDKANLGTQLTGAQNVNAFNLDKYNTNMGVWAGDKQAQSTEKAANSGK